MKVLLRSCFMVGSGDPRKELYDNYFVLRSSGLEFNTNEDQVLWRHVQDFVRMHNHVPDNLSVRHHFEQLREDEIVKRLAHLSSLQVITRGDFITRVTDLAEERRIRLVGEVLQDAADIVRVGREFRSGKEVLKLKGPAAAIKYILDKSHDIVAPTLGGKLSGEVTRDGTDFQAEYKKIAENPRAGVGQHTGIFQMDTALNGAKRHELWVHAAFTGGLKCVAGDTRIFDLATGKLHTVFDLYTLGHAPLVHTLDEKSWEITRGQASTVVQSGVRPIFRITSKSGRQIRVSGNHPFLTPEGWINAEDLQPGSWVAMPGGMPGCTLLSPFSDEEIALIGYLLGDGHIKDDISFTNGNPEILDDFVRCLKALGYKEYAGTVKSRTASFRFMADRPSSRMIRVSKSTGNSPRHPWTSPLRLTLERLGLWGCTSGDKHIPLEMWQMTDKQVWVLLAALWAADGTVRTETSGRGRRPRPKAHYTTKSRRLAWDIQALLQRVGVSSTIAPINVLYQGEYRRYWTLLVTTNEGKRQFLSHVRIAGKGAFVKEALAAVSSNEGTDWVPPALLSEIDDSVRAKTRQGGWHYARHAKRKGAIQRDTAVRLALASANPIALKKVQSTIHWDRLVEIVPDGGEMTYDLSVPGTANFVANGFIVHNSTLMLNWAYNQAIWYKWNSLIFSLEMPYQQCRRLLYSMHSFHRKFDAIRHKMGLQKDPTSAVGLPYVNIRDGTLAEWHPEAEKFLEDFVIPDMNGIPVIKTKDPETGQPWFCDYGRIHIEVADPEKSDFTVIDMRQKAELLFSQDPFSLVFVDHAGLMAPRKWVSSTTDRLNEVIRDLKRMAMSFNKGQGLPVVALFQINREGYRSAMKSKDKGGVARYDLTHLSYSNECCKSLTLLRFARGAFPIREAVVGDRVWSNTGWKDVLGVYPQGDRPIWCVQTDRGSKLECTADHRVRVFREEQLEWEQVENLKPGDWLLGSRGGSFPEVTPVLPESWGNTVSLSDDLAYLLGAWHGDGSVRPHGVAFTENRKEVTIERLLINSLERVHGAKKVACYHYASRPGSFDMELYDASFKRWFEDLAEKRCVAVPRIVREASQQSVIFFLKGLFDTDGWINNRGIIGVSSKTDSLLRQVQLLFQAMGIDSHLSSRQQKLEVTNKSYTVWTLRIRGWESCCSFVRLVGFSEPWKQERAMKRLNTVPKRKRSDQVYPFPKMFRALVKRHLPYRLVKDGTVRRSLYNQVHRVKQRGVVPEDTVRYVLDVLHRRGVQDEDATFLQQMLDNWHVLQVVACDPTGEIAPVYDLEVGGDHEYQTGPLLSHNCERSADVVTASWIDEELSKANRVQFQCLKSRDQKPFEMFNARVEWPCRRLLTSSDPVMSAQQQESVGNQLDKIKKLD